MILHIRVWESSSTPDFFCTFSWEYWEYWEYWQLNADYFLSLRRKAFFNSFFTVALEKMN